MTDVRLPPLGETVSEGTIVRWLKTVGETVSAGEPLFEVETDKVETEVPSPVTGRLDAILVPEGETAEIGSVLARVEEVSSVAPGPARGAGDQSSTRPELPVGASTPSGEVRDPGRQPTGRESSLVRSPLTRRLIAEHGLDPTRIEGTGQSGRITRDDVLAALERDGAGSGSASPSGRIAEEAMSPPDSEEVEHSAWSTSLQADPAMHVGAVVAPPLGARVDRVAELPAGARPEPLIAADRSAGAGSGGHELTSVHLPDARSERVSFTPMRRRIAEHMTRSKATSPHVLTVMKIDYERIALLRREVGEEFRTQHGVSLTFLPFIARAVVDALKEFPHLNASVDGDELFVHRDVNLGVAVALGMDGLIVPVVRRADELRLSALARSMAEVARRGRDRELRPDDTAGGTFTLTNPGAYGTFVGAPIINQPQVAIISTDGIAKEPVVVEHEGKDVVAVHHVGYLSMSWDHRAVDGLYAAAFLASVRERLESRDWRLEL
jgi:2-oxoglutarate dehydrogenase E2 component (dihydrolipoamide succinyltransferase)